MTLLFASIMPESAACLASTADQAWAHGADAVEIRLDTYEGDPGEVRAFLLSQPQYRWIVTCRSPEEGGRYSGSLNERVALLIAAARGTGAWVDFEWNDWKRSANLRQKVRLACASEAPVAGVSQPLQHLILSVHDTHCVPENMVEMGQVIHAEGAAVAKVAGHTRDIRDIWPVLDGLRHHGAGMTAIAMGDQGLATRVLARKLGAWGSYASLSPAQATASGQISLEEMKRVYRWDRIDKDTMVYGLIGDPVAHSISPVLMNRWFDACGVNAVYLPFRVAGGLPGVLHGFLDGIHARPWLSMRGLSVTVPHKQPVFEWLGDRADRSAMLIGAGNTLVIHDGGFRGYNTDAHAAIEGLVQGMGCTRNDLRGASVDILGTGGAARALASALTDVGAVLTFYGRDAERTIAFVRDFGGHALPWENRMQRRSAIVVNCTSLGMWPHIHESPLNIEALQGCEVVYDLVYNPHETCLLRLARGLGARAVSGLEMFIRQAAAQFVLWTGIEPDYAFGRDAAISALMRDFAGAKPED